MNHLLKNLLAGFASFPVILVLILGISIASGVEPKFAVVSIITTNIVGLILHRENAVFYNISASLAVVFLSISIEMEIFELSLRTFLIISIPGALFLLLSFIPIQMGLVPKSVISAISMGLGIVLILKQLPNAFGSTDLDISTPEWFFSSESLPNWTQLLLALLIPISVIIGNRVLKANYILIIAFIFTTSIAYFLPFEMQSHEIGRLQLSNFLISDWNIYSEQIIQILTSGITIFIISICLFWGNISVISSYGITPEKNLKRSLRAIGVGNLVSSLFSFVPSNIALVESNTIAENKGTNWISVLTIISLLIICLVFPIPEVHFPLWPIAGVLIYVGIRLIKHSFQILKGQTVFFYVISILGAILLLMIDYLSAFIVTLILSLVYEKLIAKGKKQRTAQ